MTRKLSTYAKRMRRQPQRSHFNAAEWLNTIAACRPYAEATPIPGSTLAGGGCTQSAAHAAALRVRAAFDSIRRGEVSPDDTQPRDLLAHALDIAWLRAIDIAGDAPGQNPMLPPLTAGMAALRRMTDRHRQLGHWGLDGPGMQAIAEGLEVYEEILSNSSPAQMQRAVDQRMRVLRMQQTEQQTQAQRTREAEKS
jgi:hypothetical protein